MNVIIVTGEREGGKTRFLNELFENFLKKGKSVGGFLSLGTFNNEGERDFELMDLSSGIKIPLASRSPSNSYLLLGRFFFNPLAIKFGNEIILNAMNKNVDVIIMDEIGPVELEGNAWFNALNKVLSEYEGKLFISVRKRLVEAVIEKFSLRNATVIDISQSESLSPEGF